MGIAALALLFRVNSGAKGPGPGRLGFGLGGQGSWAGPAWFWLGGQGSWAGPAWFQLGGPRVLGRAGLAFIFCLDTAFIFRLDNSIIFRLATAIIFRLDTAIIFRLAIIHKFCNKCALFDFQTPFLPKKKPRRARRRASKRGWSSFRLQVVRKSTPQFSPSSRSQVYTAVSASKSLASPYRSLSQVVVCYGKH